MCGKSKQELITFYSKTNLRQHEKGHELKAPDKIEKVLEITAIKKEDFIFYIFPFLQFYYNLVFQKDALMFATLLF